MNVSYFPSATTTTPTKEISIDDFLHGVRVGTWETQVLEYRNETDSERRAALKKTLGAVSCSGTFSTRGEQGLIAHSGFICMDVDEKDNVGMDLKEIFSKDPYTYACFCSAGGKGVAVLVRIKTEYHKQSFEWLKRRYEDMYRVHVDSAPQNVSSLRFVSFDEHMYINTKAKVAGVYEEKKPKKIPSLPYVIDNEGIQDVMKQIKDTGTNIAPTYDDYLRLSFAISAGFGEQGREMFHTLCSMDAKYRREDADRKYDMALETPKRNITVGTFYWMVREAGIQLPDTNTRAIQVASIAKKSKRDRAAVEQQLVEMEHIAPTAAKEIVEQVYSREDMNVENTVGDNAKLIESLFAFLQQHYPMKKNTLTQKIEIKGIEATQEMINTIYIQARVFFPTSPITKDLVESIIFSTFVESYNPITAYIEKNRYRSSNGNIQKLCDSINSDTPMKDLFVTKWMISLIAAYEGYPVRSVLALTGGQNTGKSEFFRRLLPQGLKKYYAESKLDAGKDDDILMCQKLIVMDDEMGGKSKQDEKRFKELTSKDIFSLRAPYGKFNEDFKRLCVLCGTSNNADIMSDPTGNTRILPIQVLSIDHDVYNAIDKDELFMEAVRLYESGAEWQLQKEELQQLGELSERFEQVPIERELILKFFAVPTEEQHGEYLSTTEIKDTIERLTQQRLFSIRKLGIELRKIFGEPHNIYSRDSQFSVYKYKVVVVHDY